MRYKHSAALKSKGIMPKLGHGSCGLAAFSRRHAKYPRIASSAWIASRCSMGEEEQLLEAGIMRQGQRQRATLLPFM